MKHSGLLLNPLQCLARVFLRQPAPCFLRQFSSRPAPLAAVFRRRVVNPSGVQRPIVIPDKLSHFTRDEQIDSREVLVKGSDGRPGEPRLLRDILRNIDRETETVLLLNRPGDGLPIVEICTIESLRVRVRDMEQTAKLQQRAERERKPKQIEINWAISDHDLALKMNQLEQFVAKGKTVDILLAPKKHARRASEEEARAVLDKIRAKVTEIDGKEIKEMRGFVGKQATMHIKKKTEA